MKASYRVLTATVLLLPAFLISSCDDKSATPVSPTDDPSTEIDAPSLTTVGFGSRWHDPHIKGPKVRYFINNIIGEGCETDASRFRSQDGAEVRVALVGTQSADLGGFEDFCDVGVYPVDQKIRGKKLSDVKELDFSYAGGDEHGAPRMRIPIDCINATGTSGPYPCSTDGSSEGFAYIDARTCNDGDANVGVVNAEDKEYCPVTFGGYVYDSWQDFVDAHPYGRVARTGLDGGPALTSVVLSPIFQFIEPVPAQEPEFSPHYLIWMIDVR